MSLMVEWQFFPRKKFAGRDFIYHESGEGATPSW
jgi:hypothetical protein